MARRKILTKTINLRLTPEEHRRVVRSRRADEQTSDTLRRLLAFALELEAEILGDDPPAKVRELRIQALKTAENSTGKEAASA